MQSSKILIAVLAKPLYLLLATLVAGVVFSGAVWLPNVQLILIVAQTASVRELVSLLWSLYGAIGSNFTVVSAAYTILIALLFGVNVSLLTYYVQRMRTKMGGLRRTGVAGVGGLVSGIFGIGCAACGTFIFTSVLALFGIAGILAFLPFGGEEFGFLGVGLLLYANYTLIKKVSEPAVCPI